MTLEPKPRHPHGLTNSEFGGLFTMSGSVIFAYRGYPGLVYRRTNHANFHVRGFTEEATTKTPFDRVVRNRFHRFHLVADVVDRVTGFSARAAYAKQAMRDKLIEHQQYIVSLGKDMPERLAPAVSPSRSRRLPAIVRRLPAVAILFQAPQSRRKWVEGWNRSFNEG